VPRFPSISSPASALPASIFARLVDRLAHHKGPTYPFHIGDTHLLPPSPGRVEEIDWGDARGDLYRYGAPAGDAALIEAIVAKLAAKNHITARPSQLQITAGATHAFACCARAILDQGDEIILLAPFWPLFRGHVLQLGARPIEVPFTSELYARPDADPRALIEPHITPRTTAIYLITPNNPDGKVLGARELSAIADVARRHDLWVLADEVYEDYPFTGEHRSIAALPGMAERTLTVYSFSKAYAQAGLRVGYVVGPEPIMIAVRRLANHSIYNVPRAMQAAALAALRDGASFLTDARTAYREARDLAVAALRGRLRFAIPDGGSYLFVDFTAHLAPRERAIDALERLAAEGILLAPGDAFGESYGVWARLCYTAVPRDTLEAGLAKMAALLPLVGDG
jgi:aspartate/methionine/tyrosine aminotransferase